MTFKPLLTLLKKQYEFFSKVGAFRETPNFSLVELIQTLQVYCYANNAISKNYLEFKQIYCQDKNFIEILKFALKLPKTYVVRGT